MKILHITNNLQIGGSENDLIVKALYTIEKYKAHIVIVPLFNNLEILKRYPVLKKQATIEPALIQKPLDVFLLPLKLHRVLKKCKPDVVHAHLFYANCLARLFIWSTPIICSYQNLRDLTRWYEIWFEKILVSRTAAIITSSQAIRKSFVTVGLDKMKVIYNTFAAKPLRRLPAQKAQKKLILGTVARLHWVKGLPYAIKAIDILVHTYKLTDLEYRIVGNGPEYKRLKQLVTTLHLGKYIVFTGAVQDPAIEYRKFDLFILPSVTEGLGISILEAIVHDIPVLASNVGGIPEILPKQNLFTAKVPKAIAAKVMKYRRNVVALKCPEVLARFKLATVAAEQYALYEEIIKKHG